MYLHRKGGFSYSLTPSIYFYQGCYSQEILLNYFHNKWSKRTYDYYLLNTFLLLISSWYRSWKYEQNEDTKLRFNQYITKMCHTYQTELHDLKPESFECLIKKEMILFFNKHRILWGNTIGNIYFSGRRQNK